MKQMFPSNVNFHRLDTKCILHNSENENAIKILSND